MFRDDELELVGHGADGGGLYRVPGLVTYRERGVSRAVVDAAAALHDAITAGGATLEVIYRGRSRSDVPVPYFTAHLLYWDGRAVQLRGVTPLLVACGFVNRAPGSEWWARYGGGDTLANGVAGLVAHVLRLPEYPLPFGVVEL